MNSLIVSNYANQRQNVTFGNLPTDVKAVINRTEVRTALKKEFGIGKKEISVMDRSPIRFALLSDFFKDTRVTETAGLVLIPPKNSYISRKCITIKGNDMAQDMPQDFARCVKKAFDMVQVCKETIKKSATHPVARAWRENISQIERPLKILMKKYTLAYNERDIAFQGVLSKKITKSGKAECEIDSKFEAIKVNMRKEVASDINSAWDEVAPNPTELSLA